MVNSSTIREKESVSPPPPPQKKSFHPFSAILSEQQHLLGEVTEQLS